MRMLTKLIFYFFVIFIVFEFCTKVNCALEYTNIKCTVLDENYCGFEYCYIKSINRTYKYASLKVILRRLPITEAFANAAIAKRLNGYKPFLYNITFDVCKYLGNPNPGNKVINFFYSLFKPYSNVNHSCPYNHDLAVDKVPANFLDHMLTAVLPFPRGEYRMKSLIGMHGAYRANVEMYFTIS